MTEKINLVGLEETRIKNEEVKKEYEENVSEFLKNYFYNKYNNEIKNISSIAFNQTIEEGLENIICEILEDVDVEDKETNEELIIRLENCLDIYSFPKKEIKEFIGDE